MRVSPDLGRLPDHKAKASLPEDQREPVAGALFREAEELYKAGDFAQAASLFKSAHHLAPPDAQFASLLFNIAQCYRHLGANAAALEYYERYLATAPDDDPLRANAEARIADISPLVESEPEESPRGRVRARLRALFGR